MNKNTILFGIAGVTTTLLLSLGIVFYSDDFQQGFAEIYETKDGKLLTEDEYVKRINTCIETFESPFRSVDETKTKCLDMVLEGRKVATTAEEALQQIEEMKSGK